MWKISKFFSLEITLEKKVKMFWFQFIFYCIDMLFSTNEILDSNNKNMSGEIKSQSQAPMSKIY